MGKKSTFSVIKLLFCIVFIISISFFAKFFLIDFLHVKGTSMYPTLDDKQLILFSKCSYGIVKPFGSTLIFSWRKPKRGDVVIYMYQNHYVVKRCVGIEGDTIKLIANFDDFFYNMEINGKNIPLTKTEYHLLKGSTVVPKGTIFCVGDNYENSVDSRSYGFIPVINILGKVVTSCKQTEYSNEAGS